MLRDLIISTWVLSQWPFWHDQQHLGSLGSSLICKMLGVTIFKTLPPGAL